MTSTTTKTTLRAQGLNCSSCVSKIERELRRVDGVTSATVHFSTGRIVVEHDPSRAPRDLLLQAVGRAGYTAKVSAFS
jgi:copper chaperone